MLAKRILTLALVATALWACGSDGDETNSGPQTAAQCVPKRSEPCQCDATRNGSRTCNEQGQFDACVCTCGNGVLDEGEACELTLPVTTTCGEATLNTMPNGIVTCSSTCGLVTSGCSNGMGGQGGAGGLTGGGGMAGGGGLTQ